MDTEYYAFKKGRRSISYLYAFQSEKTFSYIDNLNFLPEEYFTLFSFIQKEKNQINEVIGDLKKRGYKENRKIRLPALPLISSEQVRQVMNLEYKANSIAFLTIFPTPRDELYLDLKYIKDAIKIYRIGVISDIYLAIYANFYSDLLVDKGRLNKSTPYEKLIWAYSQSLRGIFEDCISLKPIEKKDCRGLSVDLYLDMVIRKCEEVTEKLKELKKEEMILTYGPYLR